MRVGFNSAFKIYFPLAVHVFRHFACVCMHYEVVFGLFRFESVFAV